MYSYEKVDMVLASGSNRASAIVDFTSHKGATVKRAVIFQKAEPTKAAEIYIDDSGRRNIIPSTSSKDWLDGQGAYLDRKKIMDFDAGERMTVNVTSEENQTADWEFQILFIIEKAAPIKA